MASGKTPIVAAVLADGLIAAVKFLGGALTGSSVMIAEGIHSILDGGSASLVLVYFWTTVVAMLAFFIGGGFAVLEGVLALRDHEHRRVWINFVVLAAAAAFNGVSLWIAIRELKRYQRDKSYRAASSRSCGRATIRRCSSPCSPIWGRSSAWRSSPRRAAW